MTEPVTGPEAYAEAQRLLANEAVAASPDERSVPYLLRAIGLAIQAHTAATLTAGGRMSVATNTAWREAVGDLPERHVDMGPD